VFEMMLSVRPDTSSTSKWKDSQTYHCEIRVIKKKGIENLLKRANEGENEGRGCDEVGRVWWLKVVSKVASSDTRQLRAPNSWPKVIRAPN